jgi:L-rhamnose mutarotase
MKETQERPRQRHCFLLRVRRDRLDEYRRRHEQVWPEMLAALRKTGWRNYSLFLRDDGLLIGYVEMDRPLAEAAHAMEREPINAKWQAEMGPFFEKLEGQRPDEAMVSLPEVFHLD